MYPPEYQYDYYYNPQQINPDYYYNMPQEYYYDNFGNGESNGYEEEDKGESYGNESVSDIEDDIYDQKSADCPCCKGMVYQCEGQICKDLGYCYCKMHREMENSK